MRQCLGIVPMKVGVCPLAEGWMLDFMAGFFLLFGGLKIISIKKFTRVYRTYDVVARRFGAWSYIYPFLEIGLGVLYLFRISLPFAHVSAVILMGVGAVGIYHKLRTKKTTTCACLGGFFDVPLTWVTFAENVLMAGMAVYMILA